MGDANALCVAQATHEELLFRNQVVDEKRLIRYRQSLPHEKCLVGIYLDDLLVLQLVPRRLHFNSIGQEAENMTIIRKAEQAYASVGLDMSEDKAFNQELQFEAWGLCVDGEKGFFVPPCILVFNYSP